MKLSELIDQLQQAEKLLTAQGRNRDEIRALVNGKHVKRVDIRHDGSGFMNLDVHLVLGEKSGIVQREKSAKSEE